MMALAGLAWLIGCGHTLAGPDHYVPFLAMARAGGWSLKKTLLITVVCGIGHVLGSVVLGLAGIALGWSVGSLEWFEGIRGGLAGWMLLGFGLAYTAWGLHHAWNRRTNAHVHVHADGSVKFHHHDHAGDHEHAPGATGGSRSMTPWILFTIFVFGPCEPLIPILMYPAAKHSITGILLVAGVFALATVATMTVVVTVALLGIDRWRFPRLARYSHALAGLALVACALAIQFGL